MGDGKDASPALEPGRATAQVPAGQRLVGEGQGEQGVELGLEGGRRSAGPTTEIRCYSLERA